MLKAQISCSPVTLGTGGYWNTKTPVLWHAELLIIGFKNRSGLVNFSK